MCTGDHIKKNRTSILIGLKNGNQYIDSNIIVKEKDSEGLIYIAKRTPRKASQSNGSGF